MNFLSYGFRGAVIDGSIGFAGGFFGPLVLGAAALMLAAALPLVGCHRKEKPRPEEKITLIDGSCAPARPLGDLADYSTRIRAMDSALGFIRIRSEAIWSGEDLSNVLGTVPSGTVLWAEGPLKNAEISMGIGYAVAIRDKDGRTGRGYVSRTVIEEHPKP